MIIRMYWDDHPPPHVHVEYQGDDCVIRFDTMEIVHGKLPKRAFVLFLEWAILHREELRRNWQAAEQGEPIERIAPLE